jgi:hypothetical protein
VKHAHDFCFEPDHRIGLLTSETPVPRWFGLVMVGVAGFYAMAAGALLACLV